MKVNGKHFRTIWVDSEDPNIICIIDQRHLPHKFVIEKLTNVTMARDAIRDMHVRGAGLIGVTAGYGMHLAAIDANDNSFDADMINAGEYLTKSRPTARNLGWAVERILMAIQKETTVEEKKRIIFNTACEIAEEDADFCRRLGDHGIPIRRGGCDGRAAPAPEKRRRAVGGP